MKNYTTFSEFDSECRKLAGINENQIVPTVRQKIITDFIYQIYGLMDGTNHPWWNRTTTLTVADDLEFLADVNGDPSGIITALSATAHTVTRSTGTFAAGTLLDIILLTKTTGARVAQYKARVTQAGATATYAVVGSVTGTETTYASGTHALFVSCMKKLSATSADISTLYIKDIIKVFDDQGTGSKERVFDTIKDAKLFGNVWDDPLEVSQIKCYHGGNTMYFNVGSSATALGVVQMEYIAKPAVYTTATKDNALDCPPEENGALRDSVVAEFIKATGGQVPAGIAAGAALLQARIAAANQDRVKAMELKGKAE